MNAKSKSSAGWIGIDLDSTLAVYDHWQGIEHIGEPIAGMVSYVRSLLAHGLEVRIFTARCQEGKKAVKAVKAWCLKHIGQELYVTNEKDFSMVFCVDDRAVSVEANTGKFLVEPPSIEDILNHWNNAKAPPREFEK